MPLGRPYSLHELADLKDDGERWIIPNMLQRATRAIFYGFGSTYKTTITYDLAISIATGTPFLGESPPLKTGPVLVCSTEGDIFTNRDRLLWIAAAHDVVKLDEVPLYFMQEAALLDDPRDRAEFNAIVRQVKPLLLVLDPLDSFFWGEENSATATKPVRHYLNNLVKELGCCVLVLHHASARPVEAGEIKKPRGSTAWQGWADTIIRAREDRRPRGKASLVLDIEKQRNGRAGELARVSPRIQPDNGLITFDVGTAEPHGLVAASALDFLRRTTSSGPQIFTEIREAVGARTTTLRAALEDLEKRELVAQVRIYVDGGRGRQRVVAAWQTPPRERSLSPQPTAAAAQAPG